MHERPRPPRPPPLLRRRTAGPASVTHPQSRGIVVRGAHAECGTDAKRALCVAPLNDGTTAGGDCFWPCDRASATQAIASCEVKAVHALVCHRWSPSPRVS